MNNFEKARNAYIEARKGINIKENEKIVLECKTGWCYHFARDIPGADIKAHEKVILELKDPRYSCLFAKDIEEADIKAHEQFILDFKNLYYCYYCYFFSKNIPGANIEEHFKIILNSGDKEYLNSFIEEVNYKGTKVEEWLMYI